MLPADQFGDGDVVAVRLEQQAAQHVGQVAAQLAGVDRVAPQFGERGLAQRLILPGAHGGGDFSLAAGDEHDMPGLLGQRETDGIVGRRVAGVQGGDDIYPVRQGGTEVESSTVTSRKLMRPKPRRVGQFARFLHQFLARFDAVDVACSRSLKYRS
jgi:hypothetical protein